MDYPFQPKSIRSIKRGHFWSIPLDDGRFACGVAVEDRGQPDPRTGEPRTRDFMAALLDWVGSEPPELSDIEHIDEVVDFGYGGYGLVTEAGGQILGFRDMEEQPVRLEDCITHAGGGVVYVVNGSNRLRVATRDEAASMPIMSSLGNGSFAHFANHHWAAGRTAVRSATVRPNRPVVAPAQPAPPPTPSGPFERRPAPVEGLQDTEPDPRARKTLERAFWTKGWKRSAVPPDDLQHAIAAGLMFEPIDLDHDQAVEWAIETRSAVSPSLVAAAFVDSLASRRLDLRSALGSYSSSAHLVPHDQTDWICDVCRHFGGSPHDLNVLNFERFKFGGVRHRMPVYAAFDLNQLAQWRARTTPTQEGLDLLEQILDRWASLPPDARATDAANAVTGLIKSNATERRTLVEIAALAGILHSDADPPTKRLITYAEQEAHHPGGKSDWEYPATTWRGQFGVDRSALLDML